jgi:hypothetical protein
LETPASLKLLNALEISAEGLFPINKGGRIAFWRDAYRYNQAARLGPVFGLADLQGAPCPSGLIADHLRHGKRADFVLRIAERMLESWLLADAKSVADFLRVSRNLVPRDPESLPHPKRALVDLARRSRVRAIREDLVPEPGSAGVVGRGYTPRMTEFIEELWQPLEARRNSQSLERAMVAIEKATDP